jgi:ligand-binding sensor domain-containing protein
MEYEMRKNKKTHGIIVCFTFAVLALLCAQCGKERKMEQVKSSEQSTVVKDSSDKAKAVESNAATDTQAIKTDASIIIISIKEQHHLGYPAWTNYINGDYVQAVAIHGNDVWAGSIYGGGLVKINRITEEKVFYTHANSGLPDNYVNAIAIDSNGHTWIGTKNILSKYDGTSWTSWAFGGDYYDRYGIKSGKVASHIHSIAIDKEGNTWIGINHGLIKYNGKEWAAYDTSNSGLPDLRVQCITIDTMGNKWIGTNDGLAVFDDHRHHAYRFA